MLWNTPPHLPPPIPQQEEGTDKPQPPYAPADFHFLYLAPGLGVEYFFEAARIYWETYKTIVVHDLSLVRLVPRRYTVAITSLARSDTAALVRDEIETTYGARVFHDPLVYDFLEDMQLTLDIRAERNEPFGVPLATPES